MPLAISSGAALYPKRHGAFGELIQCRRTPWVSRLFFYFEELVALGITAEYIAGDQQRDINTRDIEAWKKVATDAKIEVK
jgi:hypothetical protein